MRQGWWAHRERGPVGLPWVCKAHAFCDVLVGACVHVCVGESEKSLAVDHPFRTNAIQSSVNIQNLVARFLPCTF